MLENYSIDSKPGTSFQFNLKTICSNKSYQNNIINNELYITKLTRKISKYFSHRLLADISPQTCQYFEKQVLSAHNTVNFQRQIEYLMPMFFSSCDTILFFFVSIPKLLASYGKLQ